MLQRKAFKFRLKTNQSTESLLGRIAGSNRFVWNKALALQKERLGKKEKRLSYGELCKELVRWKQEEGTAWLEEVPSQTLQQTLKNLSTALSEGLSPKSLKRFPKFKKKGVHDSFRYPQGIKLDGNCIFLPKVGWMKFFKSREVVGTLKNATVSQKGSHWYVSLQTEQEVQPSRHPSSSMVGMDVGVKKLAVLSDGTVFQPVNSFKKHFKQLARAQKALARKQRGSNNYKKQKSRVNRIHTQIGNTRLDYLHKITTQISQNHACVVIEDLKVSPMSRSAKGDEAKPGKNVKAKSGLNRSILDQGWYRLRTLLSYKLSWLKGELITVDPRYTSQRCSSCGHLDSNNRTSQARFCCVVCGYELNADHNAARNILAAGHAVLACGDIGWDTVRAQESPVL